MWYGNSVFLFVESRHAPQNASKLLRRNISALPLYDPEAAE